MLTFDLGAGFACVFPFVHLHYSSLMISYFSLGLLNFKKN